MLLLKHYTMLDNLKLGYGFTFHYASIKTKIVGYLYPKISITFHYASIKPRSFVSLLYQYLGIAFLSIFFLYNFVVMLFTLNISHKSHQMF